MKILVVTSEPISPARLREVVGDEAVRGAEILVVAPALHASGLRFWMSDADEAIERAQQVQAETVSSLQNDGMTAAGDTGEADVIEAIGDALTTFAADRILLFTHTEDDRSRGEDISAEELRDRFPIPVQRAALAGD
jgi:hypothetical protein